MTDKWAIISADDCPYCDGAKVLLKDQSFVEFKTTDVLEFFKSAGFRTVPQVFHNGKHIGGYTELVRYLDGK